MAASRSMSLESSKNVVIMPIESCLTLIVLVIVSFAGFGLCVASLAYGHWLSAAIGLFVAGTFLFGSIEVLHDLKSWRSKRAADQTRAVKR